MPSGGHGRSGPRPDPNSLKSATRGLAYIPLPAAGYSGGSPCAIDDILIPAPDPRREREVWEMAWTYPQAAAWRNEPWRWHTVAMWCRQAVKCELPGSSAPDMTALRQMADQIGLTPAGLKENGWKIAPDVASPASTETAESAAATKAPSARDRLKLVSGE